MYLSVISIKCWVSEVYLSLRILRQHSVFTVLLLVYVVYSLIVCLFAVESTDCGCVRWLLLVMYKHTLISCGASCCILTVHEERARV